MCGLKGIQFDSLGHTTISMMRFAVLYFVLFYFVYFTLKFYSFLGGRLQGQNSGDGDEWDQGYMVQDSQRVNKTSKKENIKNSWMPASILLSMGPSES